MLFGAAYYPEHRDPAKWDYDLDNMVAAGCNTIRVGEFAWKRFEPKQGKYDFSWLDDVLARAVRRGIKVLLCPPLRTAPAWLVKKDPTIMIEDATGSRVEFGTRYTFCINHPRLRKHGFALAERMAKRYGTNPGIVGWHLDNEYGADADCHCPICTRKWREWLDERYRNVKALNERWGNVFWGLEYDDFDQVPTPRSPRGNHNPAQIQAWRRFRSDCTVETVRLHGEALESVMPGQFITTNCQSPYGNRTDYARMAENVDICGTNYYPPYDDNCLNQAFRLASCRGYKGKPFLVLELRSGAHPKPGTALDTPAPGAVERLTAHAIGNGADGIYYFRWRICPFGAEQAWGSVTGYDGKPGRVYEEIKATKRKLDGIEPELAGTEVVSEAALLWDVPSRWDSEWEGYLRAPAGLHSGHTEKLYREFRACG